MTSISVVSRRDFLKVTGVAGTGLVLGFQLPFDRDGHAAPVAEGFKPNIWLRVGPDGEVTLWVHRSELGQGARTALPQILADELELEWADFQRVQAQGDEKYGSQVTGGSTSVRTSWEPLRKAGATARAMLTAAAAAEWGVEAAQCHAERGAVVHAASGRRLGYGDLAEKAARLEVPQDPPLKDPEDFHIIGEPLPHLDHPARVAGTAPFGLDMRLAGMRFATVARSPVFGGSVQRFDAASAKAADGVLDVVEIDSGVAVVAESTWAAIQGRGALEVEFDFGDAADLSSEGISRMFEERQDANGVVTRDDGDCQTALANLDRTFKAVFEVPFVSHAPLEPQNCTAHFRDGACEIWVPSQAPQWARRDVASALGLPPEKVTVNVLFSGGAFGRRLIPDFAVEAAQVSRAIDGPVQVVWTREDDMHHDFYRPASRHVLEGGLDADGTLVAWRHRVIAPSIVGPLLGADDQSAAGEATGGAADLPYAVPNVLVDWVKANTPVPTGWWRSVFHSQTAFANECFMDELAAAAGVDAVEYRLALLNDSPRHRGVLELAAEKAGWGKPTADGHHLGLALHASFQSWAAQVAEVSVAHDGTVRVHRVVCAIDCGRVVNPDGAAAQVEGGIVLGLTAALKDPITLQNGRVAQNNFNDYRLLTIAEMPNVEAHFVTSQLAPTGVGEPPVPPIAPAVANAIFNATGTRVRRLPIRPDDLKEG